MTRLPTSTVPVCRSSSAPWRTGWGADARTRIVASMRRAGSTLWGSARMSPRMRSFLSTPIRLAATRLPGPTFSTFSLWRCSPRTRTKRPPGTTSISSPTPIEPSTSVPVTTVPKPLIVNTRSTGSRGRPESGRSGELARSWSRAATSSGSPVPVTAETASTGEPSSDVPLTAAVTSSLTRLSHSPSTRSALVSTTRPRRTSSRSTMSRCSRVCGMTPSSDAITSRTASSPCAPASMLRMKRAWPGTSTIPISRPLGRVMCAKPRSIVMPRRFSSASRSGSIPVRAVIRVDLPWSMWPAVPTTKLIARCPGRRPPPRRSTSRPHPSAQYEGQGSTRPSLCGRSRAGRHAEALSTNAKLDP